MIKISIFLKINIEIIQFFEIDGLQNYFKDVQKQSEVRLCLVTSNVVHFFLSVWRIIKVRFIQLCTSVPLLMSCKIQHWFEGNKQKLPKKYLLEDLFLAWLLGSERFRNFNYSILTSLFKFH